MASVQTKISFRCKKKFQDTIKKLQKENASVPLSVKDPSSRPPLGFSTADNLLPKRAANFETGGSPPKLHCSVSPSHLVSQIKIHSPSKNGKNLSKPNEVIEECTNRKDLSPVFEGNKFSNARKALHSALPDSLPTREDKINDILKILTQRLCDREPQSIYISGPPGTGKTACINSILSRPEIAGGYKIVFVNCTGLKSAVAIYSHICRKLNIKPCSSSSKGCQNAISKYLSQSKKMNLFVLDEMDQLECKGQGVLYSLLELSSKSFSDYSTLILIGIANSLDLTDRALPRLAAKMDLKPTLIHFSPYTKDEIITIIKHRLNQGNCDGVFEENSLNLLANKIATVSGDVRRALDIATHLIDIAQVQTKGDKISVLSVMETVNTVYSTSEQLLNNKEATSDGFPLQQKLLVCSLMLIKLKSKLKEITIGRLHDVYRKVCEKRNFNSLDISEFLSLVELVEVRGILKLQGKQKNRLSKVVLQWDQQEISSALQDKELLASILNDSSCIIK